MKILKTFSIALIVLAVTTCFDDGIKPPTDTISVTATHDCKFQIFDSSGNQLANDCYELGKQPTVITMKTAGTFLIVAETYTGITKKEKFKYISGHLNYYIEF